MVARLVAVLGVVLLVASCVGRDTATPSDFVDGTSVHSISIGGHESTYRLYKPKGLPASAPLVVMLHGGIMAYTLACETTIFAAIGPDSATQLNACATPHPTSVMHIHGTADHCGTPATTTSGPLTTSTAGCADNRSVVLITVDRGGHQWPSFTTGKPWEFFVAHLR